MEIRRLTETAYRATFAYRMHDVTGHAQSTIDIDPYVAGIPADDLRGLALLPSGIRMVYRDAHNRYEHVLLPLERPDLCLVIVLDVRNGWIHGHHLLDLGTAPE